MTAFPIAPDPAAHDVSLSMVGVQTAPLLAGSRTALKVLATCSRGCDLRGARVVLRRDADTVVARLTTPVDGGYVTDSIDLAVPTRRGAHTWQLTLEGPSDRSCLHAGHAEIVVDVAPHPVALAVWQVPSAVPATCSFELYIGVKCLAGCPMPHRDVVIVDEQGRSRGHGRTGIEAWPGTDRLFFALLTMTAPEQPRVTRWCARLAGEREGTVDHDRAEAAFGFSTIPAPDHRLRLKLVEEHSLLPVDGVEVHAGRLSAYTGSGGDVEFALPDGTHEVWIRKDGFEAPSRRLDVHDDISLEIVLTRCPTREEWERTLDPSRDVPWG